MTTKTKATIIGYLHPTKGWRPRKFVASEKAVAVRLSDGRMPRYITMEQRMVEAKLKKSKALFDSLSAKPTEPGGCTGGNDEGTTA